MKSHLVFLLAAIAGWFVLLTGMVFANGEKVAIIGGGAAGVFLSKFLTDKNHSVVVFEASNRIGGQVLTIKRKNKIYDLTTMYVPKGNMDGYGIPSCIQSILNVIKVPYEDTHTMVSVNGTSASAIVKVLQKYDENLLIDQLQRQYAFYACITKNECGYVNMSDPANFKIPVMKELSSFVADVVTVLVQPSFGQIPFENVWTPPLIWRLLSELGVTNATLSKYAPPSLRSYFIKGTGNSAYWRYVRGYQNFFDEVRKVAEKQGAQYRLNANVSNLFYNTTSKKWTVSFKARRRDMTATGFDRVILAVGNARAAKLVPFDGFPIRQYLELGGAEDTSKNSARVFVTKQVKNPYVKFNNLPNGVLFVPDSKNHGQVNPNRTGTTNYFKFFPSDKVVAIYGVVGRSRPAGETVQQFYQALRKDTETQMGITVEKKYFFTAVTKFPALFRDSSFIGNITKYANMNGLLVAGEGIFGAGIPPICGGSMNLVNKYF